jgi:hypothetical protein
MHHFCPKVQLFPLFFFDKNAIFLKISEMTRFLSIFVLKVYEI